MPAQSLSALVRKKGALTMIEAASHVAGEPIRGSWWSHPAGGKIFNALQALDDDADVLACKLGGKQAFLHRRLWPALARAQRERALWPRVSPEAKKLLTRARRAGHVLATGKLRLELERAMLAIGREVHTETGEHRVALVPFEKWLPPEVASRADALSLDDARSQLGPLLAP